jgi:tetratricopeptide (TPR) repeat protein
MLRLQFAMFLVAALSLVAAHADQNDPQLDGLFGQLQKAPNAEAAAPLEGRIWQLWTEHANPACNELMLRGISQLNVGELKAALATFSKLIELAPEFAEAWNKRATVQYLLQNYAASELDIQQTLVLEPFHFGALSGRALVKIGQMDYEGARNALHATLEVHPTMSGARENLAELDAYLRKQSI